MREEVDLDAVFIDFMNAFDTVLHRRLLEKLEGQERIYACLQRRVLNQKKNPYITLHDVGDS